MTCGLATALEPPHFNHAPVRGAIGASFSRRSRAGSFNPRTRVGCDFGISSFRTVLFGFNPRTRVGCDGLVVVDEAPFPVSIHAPAWGATFAATESGIYSLVSIHAPAWGATPLLSIRQIMNISFNPRTRVGCDLGRLHYWRSRWHVSIHAPAWGATDGFAQPGLEGLFQSTHPRGVRRSFHCKANRPGLLFQSTHPRGVRPGNAPSSFGPRRFQSTHPRGVRQPLLWGNGSLIMVSIHAPAWGATTSQAHSHHHQCEFQSTHPRGVRRAACIAMSHFMDCFNPRTRVGCIFISTEPSSGLPDCFNPRTRVGCDVEVAQNIVEREFVSIHAPAWGATARASADAWSSSAFQSTHPRGVRLRS